MSRNSQSSDDDRARLTTHYMESSESEKDADYRTMARALPRPARPTTHSSLAPQGPNVRGTQVPSSGSSQASTPQRRSAEALNLARAQQIRQLMAQSEHSPSGKSKGGAHTSVHTPRSSDSTASTPKPRVPPLQEVHTSDFGDSDTGNKRRRIDASDEETSASARNLATNPIRSTVNPASDIHSDKRARNYRIPSDSERSAFNNENVRNRDPVSGVSESSALGGDDSMVIDSESEVHHRFERGRASNSNASDFSAPNTDAEGNTFRGTQPTAHQYATYNTIRDATSGYTRNRTLIDADEVLDEYKALAHGTESGADVADSRSASMSDTMRHIALDRLRDSFVVKVATYIEELEEFWTPYLVPFKDYNAWAKQRVELKAIQALLNKEREQNHIVNVQGGEDPNPASDENDASNTYNAAIDDLNQRLQHLELQQIEDIDERYEARRLSEINTLDKFERDRGQLTFHSKIIQGVRDLAHAELLDVMQVAEKCELLKDGTDHGTVFKGKINLIAEQIENVCSGLDNTYRAMTARMHMNDPDSDDIKRLEVFYISSVVSESFGKRHKLIIHCLRELKKANYRHGKFGVHEQVYADMDRYPTHFWKKVMTIERFVTQVTSKELHLAQWQDMLEDTPNYNYVVKYLERSVDPEFPMVQADRNIVAFNNGLYIKSKNYFYHYRSPEFATLSTHLIASKFLECDFNYCGMSPAYCFLPPDLRHEKLVCTMQPAAQIEDRACKPEHDATYGIDPEVVTRARPKPRKKRTAAGEEEPQDNDAETASAANKNAHTEQMEHPHRVRIPSTRVDDETAAAMVTDAVEDEAQSASVRKPKIREFQFQPGEAVNKVRRESTTRPRRRRGAPAPEASDSYSNSNSNANSHAMKVDSHGESETQAGEDDRTRFIGEKGYDPLNIPTPKIDSIFHMQGIYGAVLFFAYALFGRMNYEVASKDDWQVALFIKGLPNTGKSILINLLKRWFDQEFIGTVSSNAEKKFGLANWIDKFILLWPEMRRDSEIPQGDIQSIISGDPMMIPIKFGLAVNLERWIVPLFITGNEETKWSDLTGAMARRLPTLRFRMPVPHYMVNDDLNQQCMGELGAWIRKCNECYHAMLTIVKRRGGGIWHWLPDSFMQERIRSLVEGNPLSRFLAFSQYFEVTNVEDDRVPFPEIHRLFDIWKMETMPNLQRNVTDEHIRNACSGIQIVYPTENVAETVLASSGFQYTNVDWVVGLKLTMKGLDKLNEEAAQY